MAGRNWTRRSFLRAAGLAGLAPFALPRVLAGEGSWSSDFARALEADPMLLGWRGVQADRIEGNARIEGRLPAQLRGTLYRNGPAVHERFGLRYRHWFEGDGMIHAFRFDGRGLSHRARVLGTPKLRREREVQRRLYSSFATHVDDGAGVRGPDDVNTANTSVLDHHGELLALWEGGSASVLDRDTLAWRSFKSWGEHLDGVPFTAHPKVEADGSLWAFGCNLVPSPALVLYHIAPDGALVKASRVDAGPLGMVHDFVVTHRHLVLVIPPLVFEPSSGEASLLDSLVWRPALGSRVLVVDKDDFGARRWYQLPAGFGFHHGNGWEDAGGTIRFDHCVAEDASLMIGTMRYIMRGEVRPSPPEVYTRYTLHPHGRAVVETTGAQEEFPRIAPALTGAPQSPCLHARAILGARGGLASAPCGQAGPGARNVGHLRLRAGDARRGARLRAEAVSARRGRRLAGRPLPGQRAGSERCRGLRCPARRRRAPGARLARLSPAARLSWTLHGGLSGALAAPAACEVRCGAPARDAAQVRRVISPASTASFFAASSSRCECMSRPIGVAHECTRRFTGTYAINAHDPSTCTSQRAW